jgi:hypothetical protein
MAGQGVALAGIPPPQGPTANDMNIIGPKEGYSPQIGTLVSMMAWLRPQVMELGDLGRQKIKGNTIDYYLGLLEQTRESTLAEFRKRDDKWLMTVDEKWPWGPTNNYCKWFHVCEHESHHLGQINLLKGRLPGAKGGNTM